MDIQLQMNNMESEYIITVDEQDKETGYREKLEVHRNGILHRAFSAVIFNNNGEMLLQKRAKGKYHSPGLWSNTCCSHQRVGETLTEAVSRRIQEELGFTCDCKEIFQFKYYVEFDNGLMEHEIDHVFLGYFNEMVTPREDEVEQVQWVKLDQLRKDMKEYPQRYTVWFKILMEQPEMLSIDKLQSEDK